MLVTTPGTRATLPEVMSHPWMVRNFSGPPDAHLVQREPLRADELERDVIRGMTGFEFGTEDDIESRLSTILTSPKYRHAVDVWERKREAQRSGKALTPSESYTSFAALSGSTSVDSFSTGKEQTDGSMATAPNKRSSKRFSGLDFYRKKLFSSSSSPPTTPGIKADPTNLVENREMPDPTRGFHPLISIYYLVREKLERERVYGPGHFASSQLSLVEAETAAAVAASAAPVPTPAGSTLPTPLPSSLPAKPPTSAGTKADYSMPLPRLPAPEKSHYSELSYDSPQSSPNPAQTAFSGAQPRAKTDIIGGGLAVPMRHPASGDKENVELPRPITNGAGLSPPGPAALPRAVPTGTHRRSQSLNQRPSVLRAWGVGPSKGIADVVEEGSVPPHTAGPEVQGFADRQERQRVRSEHPTQRPVSTAFTEKSLAHTARPADEADRATVNGQKDETIQKHKSSPTPEPPMSPGATLALVRRFGTLIGRGDGDKSKPKRGSILIPQSSPLRNEPTLNEKPVPPTPVTVPIDIPNVKVHDASPDGSSPPSKKIGLTTSQSHPVGGLHRRAATVLDPGVKSHQRRGSVGSVTRVFSVARGATGRRVSGPVQRPSTAGGLESSRPAPGKIKEEEEQEATAAHNEDPNTLSDSGAAPEPKPVYLKGLFSVATTSTKSPSVIRSDVRRVLDRMQVQYREIRGGFECIHLPSIDLSSIQHEALADGSPTSGHGHRHMTIVRKVSRISFGARRGKEKELPERPPSSSGGASGTPPGTDAANNASSLFKTSGEQNGAPKPPSATRSTNTIDTLNQIPEPITPSGPEGSPPPPSPIATKFLPPIPRDYAAGPSPGAISANGPPPSGQVDSDVFERTARNTLCVRFEVNIVKVSPFNPSTLILRLMSSTSGSLASPSRYTIQESWR
jgi:hypothetical protein